MFIKSTDDLHANDSWIKEVSTIASKEKLFIVTAVPEAAKQLFKDNKVLSRLTVLSCDVTAIKTAARAVPTLYKMNGPVVVDKWSGANFKKAN